MADGQERTAEEREAARRERDRRRTGIFNAPDEALPPIVRRAPADPPATVEHDVVANEFGDDHGDHDDWDAGYSDEAPETERPSGTRRVSRLQPDAVGGRPRAARDRPQRPQRRAPTASRRRPVAGQRERKHTWLGRGVVLLVLVLAAVLAWFVIKLYQPFGTSPHGRVTVVIPAHSGAHQVGDLLARDGVVPSGFFFELRATLSGERGKLRSGTYELQQGMSYSAVLTKLTTAPPAAQTSSLTIAEGHTRQYVNALLRKQGIKGSYLAATRRSPLLSPQAYGAPRSVSTLEGFLFPDTFRLVDPIKISSLVDDQLRDFKQRFAGVNLSYARSKHLTAYDVLKIASMIEAEAAAPRDRPLIASVIYNRLADGMMLQFDSTTRYATGNFTGALTVSQLHSPSPYNTHTHLGLPPTPIDSPGLAAIQAAAHPAQTNYLYFFTKPCNAGASVYTSSYSRFLYLLAVDRRTHC
jgi:uncharacterized YceG family protein